MNVPKSLSEAIEEEPERFIKYFNIDKIASSKNPYQTFLIQFQRKFASSKGLFLWNYILDNYKLTNRFYQFKPLQQKIPTKFRGDIDKESVLKFFNKYKQKAINKQIIREKRVKRPIRVLGYKTILTHSRTRPHKYTEIQKRFVLSRKGASLKVLADEFNRFFGLRITRVGIRDKRLRILGRK